MTNLDASKCDLVRYKDATGAFGDGDIIYTLGCQGDYKNIEKQIMSWEQLPLEIEHSSFVLDVFYDDIGLSPKPKDNNYLTNGSYMFIDRTPLRSSVTHKNFIFVVYNSETNIIHFLQYDS